MITTRVAVDDVSGRSGVEQVDLYRPSGDDTASHFTQAVRHLDRAVDGLRQSGEEEFVSRGLLARAVLHRLRCDFDAADADLAEALDLAERGHMRLHEVDVHLEACRLALARGDAASASARLERGRRLVEETGYGRRRREVPYLLGRLR